VDQTTNQPTNQPTPHATHCRKELSAKNPAVVAALKAKLAGYRASAVDVVGGGGHPDPACPKYPGFNDSHVGRVWRPWCNEV
jgi:hypothetical protein